MVPKGQCEVVFVTGDDVLAEEQEDVPSPASTVAAAMSAEEEMAQARARIYTIISGTCGRSCSFDDLEAIAKKECGSEGAGSCISNIVDAFTETGRNTSHEEYAESGELTCSQGMNRAIEEAIGIRELCEGDDADVKNPSLPFTLKRLTASTTLVCEWKVPRTDNGLIRGTKRFMREPSTSLLACIIAALNPTEWSGTTMDQRDAWAKNCREWCKEACEGLYEKQADDVFPITGETLAAVADLLDTDIAI